MDESNQKLDGKKKRLANLRPAKKGEIRNPNGRPKKQFCIPDILTQILEQPCPEDKKRTYLEAICLKAIEQAVKGDKDARIWVADRREGKALERVLQGELEKEEMKIIE